MCNNLETFPRNILKDYDLKLNNINKVIDVWFNFSKYKNKGFSRYYLCKQHKKHEKHKKKQYHCW